MLSALLPAHCVPIEKSLCFSRLQLFANYLETHPPPQTSVVLETECRTLYILGEHLQTCSLLRSGCELSLSLCVRTLSSSVLALVWKGVGPLGSLIRGSGT